MPPVGRSRIRGEAGDVSEPRGAVGDYRYEGEFAITAQALVALVEASRAGLPNESCGMVAGRDGVVTRVFPLTNAAASPVRYEVDPIEQLDAYHAIGDEGLEPLAVYHSHPATPARPSLTDIAEAYDPDGTYVIVSFAEGDGNVRAFRIREGDVTELTIVETDAGV